MLARPFPRAAALVLLLLGGCATTETAPTGPASSDPTGWLMSSGKEPTKAEFTALAATCEDKGGATDTCLIDLGMKRPK